MGENIQAAFIFLVQVIFSMYSAVVILRILLQLFGASYYNPLSQFCVTLTDPVVKPLKRLMPKVRFDLASLLFLYVLTVFKLVLLQLIQVGMLFGVLGTLLLAIPDIINQVLDIYFFAILAMVILSWVAPANNSPMIDALIPLTEPVLAPIRRVISPIAGFDLSPLVVMIGVKLASLIIVAPLVGVARYFI